MTNEEQRSNSAVEPQGSATSQAHGTKEPRASKSLNAAASDSTRRATKKLSGSSAAKKSVSKRGANTGSDESAAAVSGDASAKASKPTKSSKDTKVSAQKSVKSSQAADADLATAKGPAEKSSRQKATTPADSKAGTQKGARAAGKNADAKGVRSLKDRSDLSTSTGVDSRSMNSGSQKANTTSAPNSSDAKDSKPNAKSNAKANQKASTKKNSKSDPKSDIASSSASAVEIRPEQKKQGARTNDTKSAQKSAATTDAGSTPSLEEVSAFISSLKSAKTDQRRRDVGDEGDASSSTSRAASGSLRSAAEDIQGRSPVAQKAGRAHDTHAKHGVAESAKSKDTSDDAKQPNRPNQANRHDQRVQGDRHDRRDRDNQRDQHTKQDNSDSRDQRQQPPADTGSDSGSHAIPEFGADGQPISRREKRRLEWLEKRRQWRDQKKNERIQRRLDREAAGLPDEGSDSTDAESAQALDQNNAPRQGRDQRSAEQQRAAEGQRQSNQRQQGPQERWSDRKHERAIDARDVHAQDDHNETLDFGNVESDEAVQKQSSNSRGGRSGQDNRGKNKNNRDRRSGPAHTNDRATTDNEEYASHSDRDFANSEGDTPANAESERRASSSKRSKNASRDKHGRHDAQSRETHDFDDSNADFDVAEGRDSGAPLEKSSSSKHAKNEKRDKHEKHDKHKKGSRQRDNEQRADDAPPPLAQERRSLPPPKHYFVYKDPTLKPDISDDVARIVERVENFLINELLVLDGESILIGVSGGVDSIVLLDILHILSFEHAYTLSIAHVNHGLRGEDSKRDEKFVKTLAARYDVNCHSTQVKVGEFAKKHSLSEETAARELRYKFFRQTVSTIRAQFCATAHTADDSAETLLMNLFRGTGLTGLASIPPRRALVKKTQLIRPLLCLSKNDILEYARLRELEWHEDETNTLTKYTRNKVRHDLLPKLKDEYNPKIVESLNRTATLLRRADGFIDSLIHSTYQSVVNEKDDSCTIDVYKLEALHSFLQGEIIERAISALTFGRTVSFAAIDRITKLLEAESGARENVVNNVIAIRNRDEIVLMYEQHLQEVFLSVFKLGTYAIGKYSLELEECHRNDVRIGQDKMVEYFDYDKLPYRLTLRTWHAGDSFHPIGFNGHMKVADVLTNEKVEHSERANRLVLATATDIVWLCGLRMSDDFKIDNETRRIVRASFKID